MAVEGDPADARDRGDAGDAHLGIAREAVRGRIQDRGDVATGIGPLGPLGSALGVILSGREVSIP